MFGEYLNIWYEKGKEEEEKVSVRWCIVNDKQDRLCNMLKYVTLTRLSAAPVFFFSRFFKM